MTKRTAAKAAAFTEMMKNGARLYKPDFRDYGELVANNPDNPKRYLLFRVSEVIMKYLVETGKIRVVETHIGRQRFGLVGDSQV